MTPKRRSMRSERGQTVPLFAIILTLLVGFASLAIDSTSNQGAQLNSQLAADNSALASAKAWAGEPGSGTGALPTLSNYGTDPMLTAAQQFAGVNGVDISAGGSCFSGTALQIDVFFYNTAVTSCTAAPGVSPGWTRRVEVAVPPLTTPIPAKCSTLPAKSYQCVQVQTTAIVANRFFVAVGLARTTASASTIALATPAGAASSVWTWGNNSYGDNGDGTTSGTGQLLPTVASAGAGSPSSLAGGEETNVGLAADGTISAWGKDDAGQVGDGGALQTTGCRCVPSPGQVVAPGSGSPLINITQIASPRDSVLARRVDGTVWGWGGSVENELGNTTASGSGGGNSRPLQVMAGACTCTGGGGFLNGVATVGAGNRTGYAIRSDGTLWAWGDNSHAEIEATKAVHATAVQIALTHVIAITGGMLDSLALKDDGTVWAWGANTNGSSGPNAASGDTTAPTQVTGLGAVGIRAIAAGFDTDYALATDGTLWAWGHNDMGQLGNNTTNSSSNKVPVHVLLGVAQNLDQVGQIAAGQTSAYALRANGDVYGWGDNALGEMGNNSTTTPQAMAAPVGLGSTPPMHNVVELDAGGHRAAAVVNSSALQSWGYNANGQLGNGGAFATVDQNAPVPVSGLTGAMVTAMTGGDLHSLALKSDGTVWAWGYNTDGELGNNNTPNNSSTPVHVCAPTPTLCGNSLSSITAISAGQNHGLALKSDGTVWSWGHNSDGQLGNNTKSDGPVPVQVCSATGCGSFLTGVVAIATGQDHSLALKFDGTVWTWGKNASGELGNNSTTPSLIPVAVSGLSGVKAIAGGQDHSLALKSDGTAWAWGNNNHGQLGNGGGGNLKTPVQVSGLAGATAVSGGYEHSLALKSDGTAAGWGSNSNGQLADALGDITDKSTATAVFGLTGVAAIAQSIDSFHSMVRKADGTAWSWGMNSNGQLGDTTNGEKHAPVQVSRLAGVRVIAGGALHSLAITSAAASGSSPVPPQLVG